MDFKIFSKFSNKFKQFKLVGLHILQNFFSCLKTENLRSVAKSHPVCVELKVRNIPENMKVRRSFRTISTHIKRSFRADTYF